MSQHSTCRFGFKRISATHGMPVLGKKILSTANRCVWVWWCVWAWCGARKVQLHTDVCVQMWSYRCVQGHKPKYTHTLYTHTHPIHTHTPYTPPLYIHTQVCNALDVPLHVVPLTDQYWDSVVKHSIQEIKAGRTPNPDVLCNSR